ncbi:hypothetical protein [Hymenobacter lucidus]|uniref:Uncharacterized protein n=1 Tax=Hymenobacter lucidus TaxID=2880930 RepID=A0ABS8AWG6_9BACT|nr:hypothetical protein [Hymenobacter lucidus]MCB2410151.1 hypothetical protein [Hymenobacter lucidus]
MDTPQKEPLPTTTFQPKSLEESVMEALNMLDPATAMHELELLDETEDASSPVPPDSSKKRGDE